MFKLVFQIKDRPLSTDSRCSVENLKTYNNLNASDQRKIGVVGAGRSTASTLAVGGTNRELRTGC